jgi:hypothetical protein
MPCSDAVQSLQTLQIPESAQLPVCSSSALELHGSTTSLRSQFLHSAGTVDNGHILALNLDMLLQVESSDDSDVDNIILEAVNGRVCVSLFCQ